MFAYPFSPFPPRLSTPFTTARTASSPLSILARFSPNVSFNVQSTIVTNYAHPSTSHVVFTPVFLDNAARDPLE